MRPQRVLVSTLALAAAIHAQVATAQNMSVKLQEVAEILESGDADRLGAEDPVVEYLLNYRGTDLQASDAVALLEGCTPSDFSTAVVREDRASLVFVCPNREPSARCTTGDLELRVLNNSKGLNVQISEIRPAPEDAPECRLAVPPPAPVRGGNR